jgi:cytochrome c-type biogenesis protein CcmE
MKSAKNKRYLMGTLVIVGAIGTLLATSMKSSALRAVPVAEICAKDNTASSLVGHTVRIVGWVGHEKVRRVPLQTPSGQIFVNHFTVIDQEHKDRSVKVAYRDALPDTFRAGSPVQVDGLYKAAGLMDAERVLTKCPSKYEADGKQGQNPKGAASAKTDEDAKTGGYSKAGEGASSGSASY